MRGDCVAQPTKICFNCDMERACESCLDRISQQKTISTDINMVKRKPAIELYQMLPFQIGEYEH